MKGSDRAVVAHDGPIATDGLAELVRDALLHLYDGAYLQNHALARAVAGNESRGFAERGKMLMRDLLGAVEALRPARGAPADSRSWRSYRLLELRYVHGQPTAEVQDKLAISKTQYRRDHGLALESIASLVRERWQLADAWSPPTIERTGSLAVSEAKKLTEQMSLGSVDLVALLAELIHILGLASGPGGIRLDVPQTVPVPVVRGDRVALRQVFMSLFNAALERSGSDEIAVVVEAGLRDLSVSVLVGEVSGSPEPTEPELDVAHHLVEALDGTLTFGRVGSGWKAHVALPAAPRPLVLVLDNNPDFISLISRYLTEHVWQVVGANDVEQAKTLALELRPRVILLDVMLPGQDGWDLMIALRARAETRDIPVVVCSVLYEPRVARALGAASYLRKPVTQSELLEALAPWQEGATVPAT